jgi:hypothetical protein
MKGTRRLNSLRAVIVVVAVVVVAVVVVIQDQM